MWDKFRGNAIAVHLRDLWKSAKSSSTENIVYTGFALALLFLVLLLFGTDKLELLPATFFSATTAAFSFLAYKFSKEKFRLDLFEKRWAVYESTLEFCSRVTQQGSLRRTNDNEETIVAAVQAANNSFRGLGWHKTRALFGDDIYELFKKLNKSYAWLTAFSERPEDPIQNAAWPLQMLEHSTFVWETVEKLPDVFKPYVYFGDYKR